MLYEANSVQHRNVKFTSFQPSRAHYNPTIISFTSASKNLTQFVKVLLVKLSEMLHRQISSDFSTVKVLRYTVCKLLLAAVITTCVLFSYTLPDIITAAH